MEEEGKSEAKRGSDLTPPHSSLFPGPPPLFALPPLPSLIDFSPLSLSFAIYVIGLRRFSSSPEFLRECVCPSLSLATRLQSVGCKRLGNTILNVLQVFSLCVAELHPLVLLKCVEGHRTTPFVFFSVCLLLFIIVWRVWGACKRPPPPQQNYDVILKTFAHTKTQPVGHLFNFSPHSKP